jgi:putative membrane protein insertion efficiency factor
MKNLLKYLLLLYQKTKIFGGRCRYYPSCSQYAIEAIEKHGAGKGLLLTSKRIMRCNQFFPGGQDPVPEKA